MPREIEAVFEHRSPAKVSWKGDLSEMRERRLIRVLVFAFAAYNAGPARICELRATAAKEGLDPNEWFNSVEIIAGRKIGRDTVDNVRNILKYWVAYHLALDQNEDVQPPAAPDKRT